MLADAVIGDKRLERFRHTRPELEPAAPFTRLAYTVRWNVSHDTAHTAEALNGRTCSRSLDRTADGNPTREPAGVWPEGTHRWHGAGGSLHPR